MSQAVFRSRPDDHAGIEGIEYPQVPDVDARRARSRQLADRLKASNRNKRVAYARWQGASSPAFWLVLALAVMAVVIARGVLL